MMLKTPKSFIGVQLESKYASEVECGGTVGDYSVSTFNGSRCSIKVIPFNCIAHPFCTSFIA